MMKQRSMNESAEWPKILRQLTDKFTNLTRTYVLRLQVMQELLVFFSLSLCINI